MSSRPRQVAAALAVALASFAATAKAQDLPSGYGVEAPSGSTFTTAISPGGDSDDYAFPAFPGTKVTAVVKPSKVVAPAVPFVPNVEFVRPDGTVADDDSGFAIARKGTEEKGQSATATMTLDAPGWWQVRVRGKDLDTTGADPNYSSGGYSVSITYKTSPTRPTLPIVSKSFKTKNALIATRSDTDDYRFEGYPGQKISATVTKPKSSTLFPGLSLFRPDGSEVTGGVEFNNKQASVAATAGPDDQGTWRVRVYGVDVSEHPDPKAPANTTGAYTLSVKIGKPTAKPSLQPDQNGQYHFTLPAAGGVKLGYTLAYKGDEPHFNWFIGPAGASVPTFSGGLKINSFVVPDSQVIGNYTLTFNAPLAPTAAPTNVTFSSRVTAPPIAGRAKRLSLATAEPVILIDGIYPKSGGSSNTTKLYVSTSGNLIDPSVDDPSMIALYVDHVLLDEITVFGTTVRGVVPPGLAVGFHDVVVQTTSGQVAVAQGAFEVVPPPKALAIDPEVGSVAGGYPMTISGEGFLKLADPQICIENLQTIVPVNITSVTDTEIKFIAPNYGAPGKKTFGVVDNTNQNGDMLPLESFEYVSSPAINRLVPNLTTILGGDVISVTGANFEPTDHVYLERTPSSNQYDEIPNTYRNPSMHQFTAPVKSKGVYNVYVVDQFFQPTPPRIRPLTYFKFSDLSTITQSMFPSGTDLWDGATVAVADYDKDGVDDLFLARIGGATVGGSSQTRVLKNGNHDPDVPGQFTDVTEAVMPATTSTEDWRADRLWATDVNQDTYPDIVMVTNATTVLPDTASHVRILVNEPQNGSLPNSPRVFRDRTASLMPPVRESNPLYGGTAGVADNWRGLDMWVGDIDKGPPAPPEILITHKELKQEIDVSCVPLCSSPFSSGYTYGFYWGGSRAFFWDKNANGGLGKYKFAHNFFPRKSGLRVPVVAPGGIQIPICNASYSQPCVGRFTPFLGKRIAVGDLNGDSKPDVAVVSDATVQRIFPPSSSMVTISSLQVAINKFNPADGAETTDFTTQVTALSGDFKGDAVEIGGVGYPDGNALGSIAVAKAVSGGAGFAMRLIKFKPGFAPSPVFDVEEITTLSLPPTSPDDVWQASKILFKDVDSDGDQDMVLCCPSPPGATGPAFRILRNDIVNSQAGIFTTALMPLLQSPNMPLGSNEHFEADTMAIGDLNDDGAHDFVLVRALTVSPSPETRIVITDKKAE